MTDASVDGSVLAAETWRPGRVAGALALAVAVGAVLAAGDVRGVLEPTAAAVVAGGVAALAVTAATRRQPWFQGVASLLSVAAAFGLVAAVGLAAVRSPIATIPTPLLAEGIQLYFPAAAVLAAVAFFATLGAGLGVGGRLSRAAVTGTTWLLIHVLVPVFAGLFGSWLLFVRLPPGAGPTPGEAVVSTVEWLFVPGPPGLDSLALLATAALAAAALVVLADPGRSLPGSRGRPYRRGRRWLLYLVSVALFPAAGVVALLVAFGAAGVLADVVGALPAPLSPVLVAVGTFPPLRFLLVVVALGLAAPAAGIVLLRRFRRLSARTLWRLATVAARTVGGVAVVAVVLGIALVVPVESLFELLFGLVPQLETLTRQNPELLDPFFGDRGRWLVAGLLHAAVLGPLVLWSVVVVGFRLGLAVRALPAHGGGFAVAAACVFGASVVLAAVGEPSVVLFAGVAAAFVVWDLGEFAAGVGEEVGRLAPTRHGELVHALAAVGVGALAAVAAAVADAVAAGGPGPGDRALVVVGLAAALGAVAALLLALRG